MIHLSDRPWPLGWLAGLALVALSMPADAAQRRPLSTAAETGATIIGTDYQESSSKTSITLPDEAPCTNVSTCFVLFARVPDGKRLTITQVSCNVEGSEEIEDVTSVALAPLRGLAVVLRYQHLAPIRSAPTAYSMSNSTLQLFKAKERPLIIVETTANGNISAQCTIAGKLLDAN